MSDAPKQPTAPHWDPAFYDAGYYGKGARNGFREYDYNSPEQKYQLAIKWNVCASIDHKTALFVGCARGFEVAHWIAHGKNAVGVDVSTWAIANAIPQADKHCQLYDGSSLTKFGDSSFDLVASFDVLPHLPDGMREKLVAEMVRVAGRAIVWRQIVKNWRNMNRKVDGIDGAVFVYQRLETWDRLFTQSGKFRLLWLKMHRQYETIAVYVRA